MNIYKAKELLPIIQAFIDGEEIQVRTAGTPHKWVDTNQIFTGDTYRIKPQAIEIWCMVNSKGHCLSNQATEDDCIDNIEGLNKDYSNDFEDYKAVKFRQVLDESV